MFYSKVIPANILSKDNELNSINKIVKELISKIISALENKEEFENIYLKTRDLILTLKMNSSFNSETKEDWKLYILNLESHIKNHFDNNKNYNLNTELIEVYTEYYKIVKHISKEDENKITVSREYTVKEIQELIEMFIIKEQGKIIPLLDKSLKFEFYLLIAAIINKGLIEIEKQFEKELISLIDSAFIDYAAFICILGLWEPKEEDESRLSRNIKIASSIYSVEFGQTKQMPITNALEYIKQFDA